MGDLLDEDPDERCECCPGHYREVSVVPCTLRPGRLVATLKCDRCGDVKHRVRRVSQTATA